ncbi:hypothetical protein [Maribacter sp. 2210JD10-5]|uniref:hypothetical protein n=1 Tax=Maribacter sp. 2210JD10-5 TaxID=3386272 RepID=UPI0039BD8E5E
MNKKTETWNTIDEFPQYEISDTKIVRRRACIKVNTHQLFDEDGSLLDEYQTTIPQAPRPIASKIEGSITLLKNGKQYGRSITKLYKKYVLKIEPSKRKRHRKKRVLKF